MVRVGMRETRTYKRVCYKNTTKSPSLKYDIKVSPRKGSVPRVLIRKCLKTCAVNIYKSVIQIAPTIQYQEILIPQGDEQLWILFIII